MNILNDLMMLSAAVYLFIIIIAACIFARDYYFNSSEVDAERYIQLLFEDIWNGDEANRGYAWFRVMQHLKHYNPDPQMIRMAQYRYERCMMIRSNTALVGENGQLIDNDDSQNDMEVA